MHQVILTADGSHTLKSEHQDITYHSIHGALLETKTVFIDMGLHNKIKQGLKNISIFEMGFGTGLNALYTLSEASLISDVTIDYHTIEAYPITDFKNLNYPALFKDLKNADQLFELMHKSSSKKVGYLLPNFSFTKYIEKIEDFSIDEKFDIIYYDAFAPSAQPHLWEEPILENMYKMLNIGGILVTYCAKGEFKRVLKRVGFSVENFPGPGRKREITKGIKIE